MKPAVPGRTGRRDAGTAGSLRDERGIGRLPSGSRGTTGSAIDSAPVGRYKNARESNPFGKITVRVPTPRLIGIVLGLLLAAHLILLGFFPIRSEDTWWHLKQGELYVTTGSLPAQDPFAFTTAGRQWIHYSWVADILFYLIFRAAGLPGLVLLRLIMLFLIAGLLYRLLRGCSLHPFASVLLVFVASLALRFRLLVRPEILSFLLLLAGLAVLLRLQAASRHTAYLLLPLQAVWTNIHASFVFGIGLPALVLLANLSPEGRAMPGWGRLRLDRARLRHLAVAVACLPLAGLLNPHGASLLLFPFRQNRMTRLTMFPEWLGVWHLPKIGPSWWEVVIVLSLVLLAYIAASLLLMAREGRFDPVGWGVVLAMGTYAILHGRAVPYFVLAILPLLALALVSRFPVGFGVRRNVFPEAAVAFLERHQLDGRIFNTYQFGGYMIWRRWPANQVLIDGRYDTILFDEALLEAYMEAHRSPAALDEISAAYGVEILVLAANPRDRVAHLRRNPGWARVFWDPVAEVYVRRGGRFADLVAAHEYRLTGPADDLGYLAGYRADPDTWGRALAELRRAVADDPENAVAWLGLAQEYRAAGPGATEQRLEALTRAAALMAGAPGLGRVRAERAEALLQLGRLDEARTEAQEALRLQEDLLLPRSVLASVAERRGDWVEARQQLRTLLARLEPGDPRLRMVQQRLDAVEASMRGGTAR